MNIPIYKAVIGLGSLDFVSLVDNPAIIEKGLAFNEEINKRILFSLIKENFKATSKQIIIGPAMIPDVLMYRFDEEVGEYAVVFSKEAIEYFHEEFSSQVKDFKINFDHKGIVESAFIKSAWIIEDKLNDKSNMYGFDFPVGTLMMEVKVKDENFFNKMVKEEGRYGFSVEGMFSLEKTGEVIDKNKLLKMEKEKFSVEDILKELGTLTAEELDLIKKAVEKPVEEVKVEEKVKAEVEEVDDFVEAIEALPNAEPIETPINEEAVLAVVKPLLDEIYAMIAELKKEEVVEDTIEVPEVLSRTEKMMYSLRHFNDFE
jgi:hypothetical protein